MRTRSPRRCGTSTRCCAARRRPAHRAGFGARQRAARASSPRAVITVPELTIVIGSFLEEDQVKRIGAAEAAAGDLRAGAASGSPVPVRPHRAAARPQRCRGNWRGLAARADSTSTSTGSTRGDARRSPNLRWIQATSAGIGGFMQRTGLDGSGLTVTTAAGIHAVPLSEFAIRGALFRQGRALAAAAAAGPALGAVHHPTACRAARAGRRPWRHRPAVVARSPASASKSGDSAATRHL